MTRNNHSVLPIYQILNVFDAFFLSLIIICDKMQIIWRS